ncbi:MAG TPA: DUF3108 domain-containing protein [Bacteroidales bacterium]|nr:hypothetical protein [Bacteroidota bacterium]HJN06922.1 DUF3108 domain-containing protein [Bacteroidales bacterium]
MHHKTRFLFLLTLCLYATNFLFSQDTVINHAFKTGEYLKYRVYYSSAVGNFTAGEAILTVGKWEDKYAGKTKDVYRITGIGNSKGMFNWFYKVRDKFETFTDKNTLLPYAFIRKTREGKYEQDDIVIFDREENEAITNSIEVKAIPPNVHDMISAFYYMRTITLEDFDADSMYFINFFLDDSVYVSAVKFMGKSEINTKWGDIGCLKFAPMMASGEVFADKYPMSVWISDDENHIPILVESAVIVGSVKMELIEFGGLVNPMKINLEE